MRQDIEPKFTKTRLGNWSIQGIRVDEIIQLIANLRRGLDRDALMQRINEQRYDPPKTSTVVEHGQFIRTIEGIGKFLCKEKPIGKSTVLMLIRECGLPAVRCRPGGWLARTDHLLRWVEVFMQQQAEEIEGKADAEHRRLNYNKD